MSTLGYRRWRVSAAGDLVGLGVPHVWTPGVQVAECRGLDGIGVGTCAPFQVGLGHPVPALRSRCGIWAHKHPIRACQCGQPDSVSHGAVGVVRLWGRYVEHQTGWRAQYAQVAALVDFTGRVSRAYPAPHYPDLDSLYGEWDTGVGQWAAGEPAVWCDPALALPGPITFLQHAARAGTELQRALQWVAEVIDSDVVPLLQRLASRAAERRATPTD